MGIEETAADDGKEKIEFSVSNRETGNEFPVVVDVSGTLSDLYLKVSAVEQLRYGFFELRHDGMPVPRGAGSKISIMDTELKRNSRLELFASEPLLEEEELMSLPLPVLKEYMKGAVSPDNQVLAARSVRQRLGCQGQAPIDECVQAGIEKVLVKLLSCTDNEELQFESSWALCNIASGTGEHTSAVVDAGAIPLLVLYLGSPNTSVAEQCAWTLGNITGDGVRFRDLVLETGALERLLSLISSLDEGDDSKHTALVNSCWTLSNLLRGKPIPQLGYVCSALPVLSKKLHSKLEDVVIDAAWALSYSCDGEQQYIDAVMDPQYAILPRMIELLATKETLCPALRTLGNLATGSDTTTQKVVDAGVLTHVIRLLKSSNNSNIQRETCWLLSNLAAGTRGQAQAVLDCGGIREVVNLFNACSRDDVRKEALFVIANSLDSATPDQIETAFQQGAFTVLRQGLKSGFAFHRRLVLEALSFLLESEGSQHNATIRSFFSMEVKETLHQMRTKGEEYASSVAEAVASKYPGPAVEAAIRQAG